MLENCRGCMHADYKFHGIGQTLQQLHSSHRKTVSERLSTFKSRVHQISAIFVSQVKIKAQVAHKASQHAITTCCIQISPSTTLIHAPVQYCCHFTSCRDIPHDQAYIGSSNRRRIGLFKPMRLIDAQKAARIAGLVVSLLNGQNLSSKRRPHPSRTNRAGHEVRPDPRVRLI